ncbi:MAG: hypothetical protein PGN27_05525 [Mycolicibacterium neoaurum]|uniref:DUF6551 family protein n=1 Tax=Mycolicibacterium neoaurum TaxID=1795 RepID=UPI002FF97A50
MAALDTVDVYVTAVNVTEIFADPTYQRICDIARARKMAGTWDRRLAGILEISDRGEDHTPRYAVLDGQHRWAAAKCLAQPPTLVANVHTGLTLAEEAALFDKLNRQRKQTSPWDHWRARRASGDPLVLSIEQTATELGFDVGERASKDGTLCCISTLEKITASAGGIDLLRSTLTMLRSAWGHQRTAYEAPIVHGMAMVLYTFADRLDADTLLRGLSELPPARIRLQAQTLRDAGTVGSIAKLTAIAIANQHRRRPALTWPASWKGALPAAPKDKPHTWGSDTPVIFEARAEDAQEVYPAWEVTGPGTYIIPALPNDPTPPVPHPTPSAPALDAIGSPAAPASITVPTGTPPPAWAGGDYDAAIAEMEGRTVAEVADALSIPERTVRRIAAELGVELS